MSRVGNKIIPIPSGVSVTTTETEILVKGSRGEMKAPAFVGIAVSVDGSHLKVSRKEDTKDLRAKHGLTRALLANNIQGVSQGFTQLLELTGVGYKAAKRGKDLVLSLGYSHEIVYPEPAGVTIEVPEPTKIKVSGIDKQKVGQVSAEIRSYRKPEPYKGKGIKYQGEKIRRKAGKSGKK